MIKKAKFATIEHHMKKLISLALVLLFTGIFAQEKKKIVTAAIGFYNVENLWDIYPSADYIDGTQPLSSPKFHTSVPVDSLKYLETTEDYKGREVVAVATGIIVAIPGS